MKYFNCLTYLGCREQRRSFHFSSNNEWIPEYAQSAQTIQVRIRWGWLCVKGLIIRIYAWKYDNNCRSWILPWLRPFNDFLPWNALFFWRFCSHVLWIGTFAADQSVQSKRRIHHNPFCLGHHWNDHIRLQQYSLWEHKVQGTGMLQKSNRNTNRLESEADNEKISFSLIASLKHSVFRLLINEIREKICNR